MWATLNKHSRIQAKEFGVEWNGHEQSKFAAGREPTAAVASEHEDRLVPTCKVR